MKKYLIIVSLVGVLVGFQNCTNKSFSARTDMFESVDGSTELVIDELPETTGPVTDLGDSDDTTKEEDKKNDVVIDDDGDDSIKKEEDKKDEVVSKDDDDDSAKEEDKKDEAASSDDDDDKEQGRDVATQRPNEEKSDKVEIVKDFVQQCKDKKDGNARYLCIIDGPGKSQHVKVINDEIVVSNSTSKSACVSENACKNIIGQKLDVKSVEFRGFCKLGAADVMILTDAEVQKLVDKIP